VLCVCVYKQAGKLLTPLRTHSRHHQIWDLRSDALLQHYRAHTGAVTGAAFHPSGNFLLTSSLDMTLKVTLSSLCCL